jgi:hypothetical protein
MTQNEKLRPRDFRVFRRGYQTVWTSNEDSFQSEEEAVREDQVFDQTLGSNNPHYRSQIRQVVSATTPRSGVKWKFQFTPFMGFRAGLVDISNAGNDFEYQARRRGFAYGVYRGDFPPEVPTTGLDPGASAAANNQAIQKLYKQLDGFESSVDAGEDIGEISATLRMLRSPMKSLRDLLVSTSTKHTALLRKMQRANTLPRTLVKTLGDTALEYNFGIRPIVNTLAGALVGLQNRDYIAHYYPFQASGSEESSNFQEGGFALGGMNFDTIRENRTEIHVRYQGVWGVRADVPKRSVSDVLRLRLQDVVPTVWNLIPYSWLADYFTNIGDIVGSLSVPWGGVRWCVVTTRGINTATDKVVRLVPSEYARLDQESFTPGSCVVTCKAFTRDAVSEIPRPTFSLNASLTSGQLGNIGYLLAAKFPALRELTRSVVNKHPGLPSAFAAEVGRRGLRVPYPFHKS